MSFARHLRADQVGPTFDMSADAARPLIRQEPFQLRAGGAATLSLATQTRPLTTRMDHSLRPGVVPVLARSSNRAPASEGLAPFTLSGASGAGSGASEWSVSNGQLPGMGATADDLKISLIVAALGVLAGWALWRKAQSA